MCVPLVSVVMPVRNGMPYLPATMASLAAQSFRDYEIIVVDDASTDDTPAFVRSLNDLKLTYIRLERDPGPPARDFTPLVRARNLAQETARGRYIAPLDGDDICLPDRLGAQVAGLEADQRLVLLGCDFDLIDPNGKEVGSNGYNVTGDAALRWLLCFDSPFLHPGVMYPKKAAVDAGGYRNMTCAEDYDLFTRLCKLGSIGSLPQKLMRKRIHPRNVSTAFLDEGLEFTGNLAAGYAAARVPGISRDMVKRLYKLYHGIIPDSLGPQRVVCAFDAMVNGFTSGQDSAPGSELDMAVKFVRSSLGFRCMQMAKRTCRNPMALARWLLAAGRFDPLRYSAARLAARAIGLGRRSPVPMRVRESFDARPGLVA
jgi:hypothetical protein